MKYDHAEHQILIFAKNLRLIRIQEHNDWVVYCILAALFAFIFLLSVLNRDSNVKDFLSLKNDEANNIFPSWVLISVIQILLWTVLVSQYVPIVPEFVSNFGIFGYQLNKFGFTLLSYIVFYLSKGLLTFLFYSSSASGNNLKNLTLIASKFYFIESIILMILGFVLYFFSVDAMFFFYLILGATAFLFVIKNLIYLFHHLEILPTGWYYKFLYICTLEIVPILVLWKFLFF